MALRSEEAKFKQVTASILSTTDIARASNLIFYLNQESIQLSHALLPLIVGSSIFPIFASISAILTAAAGEAVLSEPSARLAVASSSFVCATLGLLPLTWLTSLNQAASHMRESLTLSGDPNDAAIAIKAEDDGDGRLTADESMHLQMRQMFLAQAVTQQNAGSGMGFVFGSIVVSKARTLASLTRSFAILLLLCLKNVRLRLQLFKVLPQRCTRFYSTFGNLRTTMARRSSTRPGTWLQLPSNVWPNCYTSPSQT